MNHAEAIELFLTTTQAMDSNFQFWLSITFAVLVASHLAKGSVSLALQIIAVLLYLAASVLFLMRHFVVGNMLESLRVIIVEQETSIDMLSKSDNYMIGYLYLTIFVIGTLTTATYVILGNRRNGRDT